MVGSSGLKEFSIVPKVLKSSAPGMSKSSEKFKKPGVCTSSSLTSNFRLGTPFDDNSLGLEVFNSGRISFRISMVDIHKDKPR
ncbi:Mei2-like protein [Corchorus olitorius]|uniref:Mei2-like protein n=1 Tax=Corchorus olitorius TaxID=93759 RepID=A0A1R3L0K4_9ROSI|nr:Mei2-like protein [Corchorus olitorius]